MAIVPFQQFQELLQAKASDPGARAPSYVALGDSVTQGLMQHQIHEYEMIYHQICKRNLQQHYYGTVLNVINAGVSGDIARKAVERWDRDVAPFKPNLVTIMFGHNDVHDGSDGRDGLASYMEAIDELVRRVERDTEAAVLLITPCMMMKRSNERIIQEHQSLVPQFERLAEEGILDSYVAALRTYAAERSIPCLDAYAMWEDMEREGKDIHLRLANGINHPDPLFHIELGNQLYQMLISS